MSEVIRVTKYNEVHLKLHCDSSTAYELSEYFTFNVPGARFSPAFKNKLWDGKIRLFHLMRGTVYVGLLSRVEEFAKSRGYTLEFDNPNDFAGIELSTVQAEEFVRSLELPYEVRDYQLSAFVHAVRSNRAILISPTASGKSLIIYMLTRFYMTSNILIVVPNTGLVHQLASDFVEYGFDPDQIHKVFSGQEKTTDQQVTITTWQSIYKLPKKWFDRYGAIIGDEAHGFNAKSLISIMENLTKCEIRFGLTGTLDGMKTNQLVLEGLFGPVEVVTTTAELMEKGTVAALKIKAIVLSYEDEFRQLMAKAKPVYKDELRVIVESKMRNRFLAGLTVSLKGNTLLLFNFQKHGKLLQQMIKDLVPDRDVFLVYGAIEGEERERIRKYIATHDNVIVIASYKTFSTGTNIPRLNNVIFGSPSKSRIRVLQSIGRGIRTAEGKLDATLYDVADDFSRKSYENHTIKHFSERIKMYNAEKFEYKTYTIKLKGQT
jgi:superfamily II DNA or RNA helicase